MKNYFSDRELECHCEKCSGAHTSLNINPLFLHRLNLLRDMWGGPINVSDAYRCKEHNAEVGGSPNSQHLYGNAADIYVGEPYDFSKEAHEEYKRFYKFILDSKLFDGIGNYPNGLFVHVDLRSGGTEINKYRWDG